MTEKSKAHHSIDSDIEGKRRLMGRAKDRIELQEANIRFDGQYAPKKGSERRYATLLRKLSLRDAKELKRIIDNKETVWNSEDLSYPYPLTRVRKYILHQLKIENYIELSVLENNTFVGTVSIEKIDKINRSASIGYWIAKPYRGKGIATRAVKLAVNFAFTELGLNKIYAETAQENLPSIKVLEKAGFKKAGKRVGSDNGKAAYIYSIKNL